MVKSELVTHQCVLLVHVVSIIQFQVKYKKKHFLIYYFTSCKLNMYCKSQNEFPNIVLFSVAPFLKLFFY